MTPHTATAEQDCRSILAHVLDSPEFSFLTKSERTSSHNAGAATMLLDSITSYASGLVRPPAPEMFLIHTSTATLKHALDRHRDTARAQSIRKSMPDTPQAQTTCLSIRSTDPRLYSNPDSPIWRSFQAALEVPLTDIRNALSTGFSHVVLPFRDKVACAYPADDTPVLHALSRTVFHHHGCIPWPIFSDNEVPPRIRTVSPTGIPISISMLSCPHPEDAATVSTHVAKLLNGDASTVPLQPD